MYDPSESLEKALQHVCSFLIHMQSCDVGQIDTSKLDAILAVGTRALVRMVEASETVSLQSSDVNSAEEFDFDRARAVIVEKLDKLQKANSHT